jgi:hypothetical protein
MAFDTIGKNGLGVRGHVTLWSVDAASGLMVPLHNQPNQIQFSWGYIAARQLGYRRQAGRPDYFISGMYMEYENLPAPEDTVTVSEFGRDLNTQYYDELSASATQDFLRLSLLLEPALGISTGYEDYFTNGVDGNKLTFFAQSAGTAGVHGKTFSHTVNSKIYSAALVAMPEFSDRTKDVIFARTTFAEEYQVTKEINSQIGITWDIAFE